MLLYTGYYINNQTSNFQRLTYAVGVYVDWSIIHFAHGLDLNIVSINLPERMNTSFS